MSQSGRRTITFAEHYTKLNVLVLRGGWIQICDKEGGVEGAFVKKKQHQNENRKEGVHKKKMEHGMEG